MNPYLEQPMLAGFSPEFHSLVRALLANRYGPPMS